MLNVTPAIFPAMPHVRFRQLVDRSFGKMTIGVEGEHIEDRQRTACRMWAALLADATRRYGGQATVCITYKSTEEYIRKDLHVPPWLALAHFGDVAGTDQWKDVRALYIVGRTLPRAEEVADMAGALTGEWVPQREYVEVEAPIFIHPDPEGYTSVHVKQWRHPHPVAEALRRKACEGALLQVIGRVRGMWRTADNPVDVNIWTDVPLHDFQGPSQTPCDIGYPVEPILWGDIEPGPEEMMLAYGGVWLKSAREAETAYPGGVNKGSLKDARSVSFPYKNLIVRNPYSPHTSLDPTDPTDLLPPIEEVPNALTATYRREGKGRKPSRAVFLPGFDHRTARAWLEERLGLLADYWATLTRRPIGYRP
jgi:hypothetical protein